MPRLGSIEIWTTRIKVNYMIQKSYINNNSSRPVFNVVKLKMIFKTNCK